MSGLKKQVERLLSDVTTRATSTLQPMADESMLYLFESLDKDSNGQISFEEFKGTSVQSWAAMHAIANSMPSVKDALHQVGGAFKKQVLPITPTYNSPISYWLYTWVYYLIVFQLLLGFIEHVRYWLGLRCLRKGRSNGSGFPSIVDLKTPPIHVSNQEAVPWHDTPQNTCYARFKVIFFVVTGLAPLRLIQGVAMFIFAVITLNISNIVPFKLWRKCWLHIVRIQIYTMLFSLGYYKIPIHGRFETSDKVKLLMANHVSLLEVIILFAETFPSFVSRIENLSIPLFPGIVRAVDGIIVDRSNKSNKNGALDEIKRRALDPTAPQVMIFPEGTCGNSNVLFRFNKGPFSLGKPVQLICFKYPYRHYNPCYNGRYVGGNELGDIILRCCCQFVNRIDVKVLPVYKPTKDEIGTKPLGLLYATNMQKRMAQELDIKTSNATKKDYDEILQTFHQVERNSVSKQGNSEWTSLLRRTSRVPNDSSSKNTSSNTSPSAKSSLNSNNKEDCVEGEVWWPWEAYSNVLETLKEMRNKKKE